MAMDRAKSRRGRFTRLRFSSVSRCSSFVLQIVGHAHLPPRFPSPRQAPQPTYRRFVCQRGTSSKQNAPEVKCRSNASPTRDIDSSTKATRSPYTTHDMDVECRQRHSARFPCQQMGLINAHFSARLNASCGPLLVVLDFAQEDLHRPTVQ
jgi:hypothetical protein